MLLVTVSVERSMTEIELLPPLTTNIKVDEAETLTVGDDVLGANVVLGADVGLGAVVGALVGGEVGGAVTEEGDVSTGVLDKLETSEPFCGFCNPTPSPIPSDNKIIARAAPART
jgi:hypothetical protein